MEAVPGKEHNVDTDWFQVGNYTHSDMVEFSILDEAQVLYRGNIKNGELPATTFAQEKSIAMDGTSSGDGFHKELTISIIGISQGHEKSLTLAGLRIYQH